MKMCTKCRIEKPLDEFYCCKRSKDGKQSRCKECQKRYYRSDRGKEVSRKASWKYSATEHGKKAIRKYQQTNRGRESARKRYQRYHNTIAGYLKGIYYAAKSRCEHINHQRYKDYGGRGIEFRFGSLDDFRDYVINKLQVDPRGLQIDRIDNDGHYEPGNIRFVTAKENLKNRRNPKVESVV